MNTFTKKAMRWTGPTLCSIGVATLIFGETADAVTLSTANSQVNIDPTSQDGVKDWIVTGTGGSQDFLNQHWWWYRVGSGPQSSIDTLGVPTISAWGDPGAGVEITYDTTDFQVVLHYNLTPTPNPTTGVSDLAGNIQVINKSTTVSLDNFNLFHYADFNLSAGPASDFVNQLFDYSDASDTFFGGILDMRTDRQLDGDEWHKVFDTGQFGTSFSTLPNRLLSTSLEAGSPAVILNKLNTVSDYVPNGATTTGPGDVAYVFQYEINVDPDQTATISFNNQLSVEPIPEPSTAALCLLGGLALFGTLRRSKDLT